MAFSNKYSKRWGPATIILAFFSGMFAGMLFATLQKPGGWIIIIPTILTFIIFCWFALGEEKEYINGG